MVTRHSDTEWRTTFPLVYYGERDTFRVPTGYVTDFASVPRMLQWFAPSTGKYTLAAVLHDHLCDRLRHGEVWWELPPEPDCVPLIKRSGITSRDVDGLFRRVMREQGVPIALRWFMWAGVRWGALFNRRRRPGVLRDLPLMLVLSLLALPLVLPATVCIWISYALLFVCEGVIGFVTEPWRWSRE